MSDDVTPATEAAWLTRDEADAEFLRRTAPGAVALIEAQAREQGRASLDVDLLDAALAAFYDRRLPRTSTEGIAAEYARLAADKETP